MFGRKSKAWLVIGSLGWIAGGALSGCTRGTGNTDRFALIAGGSGETIEPNFFVEDLKKLQTQLESRGWRVRAAVGAQDGLISRSVSATNAHILEAARQTLESAAPGQQALLLFHAHGREREDYWGQRSHSIVTEDKDASGNDPGFDLDALEPEIKKAQARGVKVALVDLSCYSGSSQTLQGPVCTVSLAASNYVSLCSGREEERGFNSKFFQLPPRGTAISLESQFFEARRFDHTSINLAQISSHKTPALTGWEGFLFHTDPLDVFEDLKNLKTGTKPFSPKTVLTELDPWISALPSKKPEAQKLRDQAATLLEKAVVIRKTLEQRMPALAKEYDAAPLEVSVPGRSSLKIAPAYLAELLGATDSEHLPDGYTDVQRNLVEALKPVRDELATRFEKPLLAYQTKRDEFDRLTDEFAKTADRLFELERKLYDLQPRQATATSPCSEFQL